MIEKLNHPHIGIFILAWLVADIGAAVLIVLAHKIGAVDRPHSYKTHTNATPFLGGIAIFIAFAVSVFSILRFTDYSENLPLFGMIYTGTLVIIMGTIDDFMPISAIIKLIFLFVITLILHQFKIAINVFPESYDYLNLLLTLIWIVGVTSALNSLDHWDGLAGGISAIAALATFFIVWRNYNFFAAYEWKEYQKWVSYTSIALAGALLGFLRYNYFSPARMFLGDNGSLFLGYILAAMSVLGAWSETDPVRSILIPCCIFAVPLYDITLSTILRYKNGIVKTIPEAIVYCGKDHLSHRLSALGFTKKEAVLFQYGIGVTGGVMAAIFSTPVITRNQYLLMAGACVMCLAVLGVFLDKAKVYESMSL